MMGVVGQCRLCLQQAELQDCHLIPKAAYKLLRGVGNNLHPFVNDGRKSIKTSDQIRAHLLCHDCEQRLCKNGEDTFFRYCYQEPGKFRLLDVLREQKPMLEDSRFAAYVVPEPENSFIERIGYVGLSILWKAAAHSWEDRRGTLPSIILGSKYQEQVRRYLLGTGPFLECGAMVVEVSNENNRLISVVGTPTTFKYPTNHLHLIDLCGIRFNLLVGSRIPPQIRNMCVFRPGQKCVLIAKQQEAMLAKMYREHLKVMAGSGDSGA